MSNYTKLVDYAAKDSLSSGTPLKVLSGTEINTDLAAIAVAISTKADTANATHTGTSAFAAITANSVVSTTLAGALTGNVTGNLTGNVTGDVTGDVTGSATTAATVTTAAQPAITSVGTLTSLAVSGTVDGRDVAADGVKLDAMASFSIGDTGPAGGLVFYVDHTGMHGLEAHPVQYGTTMWYDGTYDNLDARADGIGGGYANTLIIVSAQGEASSASANAGSSASAAQACHGHSRTVNGIRYAGYYLPSITELQLMRTNLYLNGVGGFSSDSYWTSNNNGNGGSGNSGPSEGKVVTFSNGSLGLTAVYNQKLYRAIRAF